MGAGVYALATPGHMAPMWQHVLAFILSPTFGALGGHLRLRQLRPGRGDGGGAVGATASA